MHFPPNFSIFTIHYSLFFCIFALVCWLRHQPLCSIRWSTARHDLSSICSPVATVDFRLSSACRSRPKGRLRNSFSNPWPCWRSRPMSARAYNYRSFPMLGCCILLQQYLLTRVNWLFRFLFRSFYIMLCELSSRMHNSLTMCVTVFNGLTNSLRLMPISIWCF